MSNACNLRVGLFVATVLVAAPIGFVQFALGQSSMGNIAPHGLLPMLGSEPYPDPAAASAPRQPINFQSHAPLARLIRNPDQTDGAPPFALTDQNGTIQRYVEPVTGIDLASHVGQVVVVRHDTGNTLLASQLELGPQPLYPLEPNSEESRYAMTGRRTAALRRMTDSDGSIEQVQYVDNDDSSVQLLPDDLSISNGAAMGPGNFMPLEGMGRGGDCPVYADQMGPPGMQMPGYGAPYQPMQYGPGGMMAYPGQMTGPCPNCGRYHNAVGPGGSSACGASCNDLPPDRAQISGDVELLLLRPQIAENAMGKFGEDYQFSPRFILALRGVGNLDGRVRYWHYDRNTDLLGTDDNVQIRFDVLDIEAIHRFAGRRSELTLSAGVRLAGIHLTDTEDEKASTDLIGITLAADGATPLVYFPGGHFGWVYGGRLSILGGDWGGDDDSQFVDQQTRNDNVLVHELYGGIELTRRVRALNVHARLLFEMQNWRSDVLAESVADIESIGFFGPGLELGAEF